MSHSNHLNPSSMRLFFIWARRWISIELKSVMNQNLVRNCERTPWFHTSRETKMSKCILKGGGSLWKKKRFQTKKMEDFYLRALFFSRSRQQFVIVHMVSQILEPTPCSLDRYVTRRFQIKFSIEWCCCQNLHLHGVLSSTSPVEGMKKR